MATMAELAEQYREFSARLRVAMEDAYQDGNMAKYVQLKEALKQCRDLRYICEHYYDRSCVSPYTMQGRFGSWKRNQKL